MTDLRDEDQIERDEAEALEESLTEATDRASDQGAQRSSPVINQAQTSEMRNAPIDLDWAGACAVVVRGQRVARPDWPTGEFLWLQTEFLTLTKADGTVHTLAVSIGDMSAEDWRVV